LNALIKPIDLLFFKYVHSINIYYFKSLTILYGVVLFSLIMYYDFLIVKKLKKCTLSMFIV